MNRQSSRPQLFTITSLLSILLLFIAIVSGCRRFDHTIEEDGARTEERFFSIASSTPNLIKTVHDIVKKQNEERHFLNKVVKNFGYPLWNKAAYTKRTNQTTRISGPDSADYVYIPFAKDKYDLITSILIVKMAGHDSLFYLLGANHYSEFGFDFRDSTKWNARDVLSLFAIFEYRVFEHDKFDILDPRLFPLDSGVASLKHGEKLYATTHQSVDQISEGRFTLSHEECVSWDVCYDSNGGNSCYDIPNYCDENCEFYQYTYTECTWYDEEVGGDGGPLGGGYGGGGGWENQNPCKAIPDPNGSDPTGTGCLTNPTVGWNPLPIQDNGYDPYLADTVRVSSDLIDSFPCLYHLIKDSLANTFIASDL